MGERGVRSRKGSSINWAWYIPENGSSALWCIVLVSHRHLGRVCVCMSSSVYVVYSRWLGYDDAYILCCFHFALLSAYFVVVVIGFSYLCFACSKHKYDEWVIRGSEGRINAYRKCKKEFEICGGWKRIRWQMPQGTSHIRALSAWIIRLFIKPNAFQPKITWSHQHRRWALFLPPLVKYEI